MLKTIVKGCEPQLATKYSAAVDLFASEDVVIGAGETKIIGLGVCIDLEMLDEEFYNTNKYKSCKNKRECERVFNDFLSTHYLELHPRSSLRAKGLISSTEIIPLDFKDEIKIIIHNPIKSITTTYFNIKDDYCPKCGNFQINDDDGVYICDDLDEVTCPSCDTTFVYIKNFRLCDKNFPFSDTSEEWISTTYQETNGKRIKKGDKIAQILLKEHKTYLMGIQSNKERTRKIGSPNEKN